MTHCVKRKIARGNILDAMLGSIHSCGDMLSSMYVAFGQHPIARMRIPLNIRSIARGAISHSHRGYPTRSRVAKADVAPTRDVESPTSPSPLSYVSYVVLVVEYEWTILTLDTKQIVLAVSLLRLCGRIKRAVQKVRFSGRFVPQNMCHCSAVQSGCLYNHAVT